jgi:hypothetical protein
MITRTDTMRGRDPVTATTLVVITTMNTQPG